MSDNFTLIFSLISLGFFGGFSHCIGMCSPFVLTQVTHRLKKMPLEKFTNLQRLKSFALIPYHLGRITTYSFIGFLCSLAASTLEDFLPFRLLSIALLTVAILVFITLFFERKLLPFKFFFVESATSFFSKKLTPLFVAGSFFKTYLLGLILGFLPCGLLYAAFLIAGAIDNPALAALGMFCFGFATVPALFVGAASGGFLINISGFKFIIKLVIIVNIITLILMISKLI